MTEYKDCWLCGEPRPIFESCLKCGGSCKPLKKKKQQKKLHTPDYYNWV